MTLRVGPVAVDVHDSAPIGIVPMIDGSSLVDLVGQYEASRGWEPAGGDDGLVPNHYFGDLTAYYLGANHVTGLGLKQSRIQVLGCNCGDAGCWPLQTTIDILPTMVTWSDFSQPTVRSGNSPPSGRSRSAATHTRPPFTPPPDSSPRTRPTARAGDT